MPVKIVDIMPDSLASLSRLKVGQVITHIDDEEVSDVLDLMFLTQKDEFNIVYLDEDGRSQSKKVKNHFDKPLGFETDLPECRQCINHCIFCFIDQMPAGLRKTLYVKDDDFIYSFFYGNFITLTNLTKKAINKIISQHISPLYVSVHTTNPALHKKIFGYKKDFDIVESLKVFHTENIEIHAQIVLMPGINDKEELFKTLTDLVEMENITTIGIVPVGLTRYRERLTPLRRFTTEEAVEIISYVEFMKSNRKLEHIYCADELFITARMPIPPEHYYENYDQIENGIGMIRKAWENWRYLKRRFISFLKNTDGQPVFVTSVSGIQAIDPILKDIQKALPDKRLKAIVIKNNFFGEEVSVTGLLTWQDIKEQMHLADDEYPVFSAAIFNHEGNTIDDVHLNVIKKELDRLVVVVEELFTQWTSEKGH